MKKTWYVKKGTVNTMDGVHSEGTAALQEIEHEDSIEISSLRPRFEGKHFPWRQVFGYLASLVLTAAAFISVMDHLLPATALLALILLLAVLQAMLQLGVFMHLRESRGMAWQIVVLGLAIFMAGGLVVASIWIMMFKSGVS